MYKIELINKKTKEVFNYEYLNDYNLGEKLYFKFEIDTTQLTDGEYHLHLYDENDELIVTDTLSVNNFNLNGIQYEKGENIYIENVIDAKTQTKQVEIKDTVTTVYPDDGYNVMSQVTVDAQQVYDNGIEKGYEDGKQDGVEEQKSKLSSITIEVNGTYTNEDGYNEVVVNVIPPQNSQPQTEVLLKTITKNGQYDYKPENADYFKEANITVNVLPKLQQKQVTVTDTNTTVTPDSNVDGFSQVSINALPVYNTGYNVGKSDGIEEQKSKLSSITINRNGTYNKEDGYNEVTVDVKTQSYSYLTNTVDEDGFRQLGWSDDDINYFKDNNLHYEWQNDNYNVTSENIALKERIKYLSDLKNLKTDLNFIYAPYVDANGVSEGESFLSGAKNLKAIPLYNISIYRANNMFSNCSSLTTIPPLNTSKATTMNNMFNGCTNLTSIPQLDTSNVTNMDYMFYNCTKLTTIPLLNTSNVTTMSSMFRDCTILTTIPPLNTSNVTIMTSMFNNCSNLTSIPQLDTSNVTNMSNMFYNCTNLTSIPLLNTSNVTTMDYMFYNCTKLTSIPLLDTSNVTNMLYMFYNCNSLTTIPLLDTSNVTTMNSMFHSCTKLTSIPLLDTSNVTNMLYMFNGCTNLTSIPQLDTSNVTTMNSMFYRCTNLTSIPLLNTSNVTDMSTFMGFSDINTLTDLGGFKDLKINWSDGYGLPKMPNLTKQSVLNVINNLYNFRENGDSTTTRTIKFHKNSLALLTDDEKAIATNKGWTLTN